MFSLEIHCGPEQRDVLIADLWDARLNRHRRARRNPPARLLRRRSRRGAPPRALSPRIAPSPAPRKTATGWPTRVKSSSRYWPARASSWSPNGVTTPPPKAASASPSIRAWRSVPACTKQRSSPSKRWSATSNPPAWCSTSAPAPASSPRSPNCSAPRASTRATTTPSPSKSRATTSARAHLFTGSADAVSRRAFDLVVANISPEAIAALAPDLLAALRPSGIALLSGFETHEVDQVRAALGAARILAIHHKNNWALIEART